MYIHTYMVCLEQVQLLLNDARGLHYLPIRWGWSKLSKGLSGSVWKCVKMYVCCADVCASVCP